MKRVFILVSGAGLFLSGMFFVLPEFPLFITIPVMLFSWLLLWKNVVDLH